MTKMTRPKQTRISACGVQYVVSVVLGSPALMKLPSKAYDVRVETHLLGVRMSKARQVRQHLLIGELIPLCHLYIQ